MNSLPAPYSIGLTAALFLPMLYPNLLTKNPKLFLLVGPEPSLSFHYCPEITVLISGLCEYCFVLLPSLYFIFYKPLNILNHHFLLFLFSNLSSLSTTLAIPEILIYYFFFISYGFKLELIIDWKYIGIFNLWKKRNELKIIGAMAWFAIFY